jgi:hypothetical protein
LGGAGTLGRSGTLGWLCHRFRQWYIVTCLPFEYDMASIYIDLAESALHDPTHCSGGIRDEISTSSFLVKTVKLVWPLARLNSCMSNMPPSSAKLTLLRAWYDILRIISSPLRLPDNRLSLPRTNVKAGDSLNVVSLKSRVLRFSTNLDPLQTSSYVKSVCIRD